MGRTAIAPGDGITHVVYAAPLLECAPIVITVVRMPADNRQSSFAEAMRQISFLPADERVEALLDFLVHVLHTLDSAKIRELRDQLMERFSTCGCSFDTCQLMIEFIDAHLALRDLTAADRVSPGQVN